MISTAPGPDVSIVIPAFNERESLIQLHSELSDVAATTGKRFEFLFVDDGSTDGTWKLLGQLREGDQRIGIVRLRRNFGKSAGLAAGFAVARGAFVITMDADLQDDPKEIPRFLDRIAAGADLVSGWKKTRHDPWHKTMPSRIFNFVVSWVTGVKLHDHNCGYKAYRREVLTEIRLYGELYRFIPAMAAARGFRIAEVPVNHRPRKFGKSKFGWRRFTRGFLDLLTVKFLTSFNHRPQHLLGGLGLLGAAVGTGLLAWHGLRTCVGYGPASTAGLMAAFAVWLVGIHLMTVGLIAELIVARSFQIGQGYAVEESQLPL